MSLCSSSSTRRAESVYVGVELVTVFFNDTATTEIYPLSLHDALPIYFARELEKQGVEIVSTGGTASLLRQEGIKTRDISEFTGFPEVLDGRLKTLHPKVHGALLYLRGNKAHEAAAREHGIEAIDLVVINLYPFEATIAKPEVKLAEAIEQIDIGGPSMLRSAANNSQPVPAV